MDLIKRLKKNKKGFTLVELIVVLVILAILAAIAIPTFNGYIKKAREKTVSTEARTVLLAADSLIAEANETGVAKVNADADAESGDNEVSTADIAKLSGVNGTIVITINDEGELATLTYTQNGSTYEYKSGKLKMEKKKD